MSSRWASRLLSVGIDGREIAVDGARGTPWPSRSLNDVGVVGAAPRREAFECHFDDERPSPRGALGQVKCLLESERPGEDALLEARPHERRLETVGGRRLDRLLAHVAAPADAGRAHGQRERAVTRRERDTLAVDPRGSRAARSDAGLERSRLFARMRGLPSSAARRPRRR